VIRFTVFGNWECTSLSESFEGKSVCGSCASAFTRWDFEGKRMTTWHDLNTTPSIFYLSLFTFASQLLTAMDTPTHSSPRLELRPKRAKAEHAIMDANRLVHEGNYTPALAMYNKLLDERCHPAYYLNRALCFVATDRPHLAVNDALRAYMMAQSVIDALRNNGEVNDHVRRIDAHIITYNGTFFYSRDLENICSGIKLTPLFR
jgi:hypothetical protein